MSAEPPAWKSNGTYRSSPLPLTPPPSYELPRLDLPPLTLNQQEDLVRRLYPANKAKPTPQQKEVKFAFGRTFGV